MRPASSFREARRRRRRQTIARIAWCVAGIGTVVVAAISGYEVGVAKTGHREAMLQAELDSFNDKQYAMEIRTAEAIQQAHVAVERWQDLRDRYQTDVPAGALKELVGQLRQKLTADVPVERISFVLDQLGKERDCDLQAETKRFMLRTPLTAGPVNNVGFADGIIILSGEGVAARNLAGLAEAWFDSEQETEIRFLQIDGEISLAKGVLPLTHSIVIGEREHIFIIRPDDRRGFVTATSQSCAYP